MLDQITTETMLNLSQEDNAKFLNLIINQPIEIFYEHVEKNKLFSEKRDVLLIKSNFLDLILSKIVPVALLTDKVLEINDMIDDMTSKMTELELVRMLGKCNLYDYYNIINMICPFTDDFFEVSIYEPIKENKLYTIDNFIKVDEQVREYLPNAMMEIQLTLLKLNSPVAVNEIVNNACVKFVKFYFKLNLVNQEYLDYSFVWSDYELAALLGIEDVYQQPEINT